MTAQDDTAYVAMCLWEACLDARKHSPLYVLFEAARAKHGTGELRRLIIGASGPCGALWDQMWAAEEVDCIGFDWEFCPAYLARALDWETMTPKPTAHEIMRAYSIENTPQLTKA